MAAKAEKPRTLRDLETDDLFCRWPLRHSWDLITNFVDRGVLTLTLDCTNDCGTSKTLTTSRSGEQVKRPVYHHTDEYLLKGAGRRPSAAEVRAEVFRRLAPDAPRKRALRSVA